MLIDWFTVVAQIVNFLVLVLLLKHFLYGRIVKAMDEREAQVIEQARQADEDRARARQEASSYTDKIQAFEDEYRERLKCAEQDVRDLRARRIREARSEVSALREQWGEALGRQQAEFVVELKRRSSEELCKIVRRALADLADAKLEQQALRVFVRELVADPEKQATLLKAIGDSSSAITISSSFPISEEEQQELTRELQDKVIGEREVLFEEQPELSCGITLHGNSHVVEWTMDAYVDELAQEFEEAVAAESRGARLAAEIDEGGSAGGEVESTELEGAAHE